MIITLAKYYHVYFDNLSEFEEFLWEGQACWFCIIFSILTSKLFLSGFIPVYSCVPTIVICGGNRRQKENVFYFQLRF